MCFKRAYCHKFTLPKPLSQREGEKKAMQKNFDALHLLSALSRAPSISGNFTHEAELLAMVSGDQPHQGTALRAACLQRNSCRIFPVQSQHSHCTAGNRVLCRTGVNLCHTILPLDFITQDGKCDHFPDVKHSWLFWHCSVSTPPVGQAKHRIFSLLCEDHPFEGWSLSLGEHANLQRDNRKHLPSKVGQA